MAARSRTSTCSRWAIPAIRTHLAFRDYLRTHPDAARDYQRLKRKLAAKHRADREAYTDAKAAFIEGIIAAAMC